MKRWMIHSMFAAAALTVVAGSGSAQILQAEIPFAFRAGGVLLQPGSYQVKADRSSTAMRFFVSSRDNKTAAVLAMFTIDQPSKAWRAAGAPKLGFDCAGGHCVLRQIWAGDANPAYRFGSPGRGERSMPLTEIRMTPVKAE